MIRFLRRVSYVLLGVVVPTLVVFTVKFYTERKLIFEEKYLLMWTMLTILISISLILSCLALKRVSELKDQNKILIQLVIELKSQSEKNHYENISYQQNSREIFIDLED